MEQKRLHHLAVVYVESDVLEKIDPERVIDKFATLKVRRHSLVLPKEWSVSHRLRLVGYMLYLLIFLHHKFSKNVWVPESEAT